MPASPLTETMIILFCSQDCHDVPGWLLCLRPPLCSRGWRLPQWLWSCSFPSTFTLCNPARRKQDNDQMSSDLTENKPEACHWNFSLFSLTTALSPGRIAAAAHLLAKEASYTFYNTIQNCSFGFVSYRENVLVWLTGYLVWKLQPIGQQLKKLMNLLSEQEAGSRGWYHQSWAVPLHLKSESFLWQKFTSSLRASILFQRSFILESFALLMLVQNA